MTEENRLYKTALCERYAKGKCHNGDSCTFAHGAHERRPRLMPALESRPDIQPLTTDTSIQETQSLTTDTPIQYKPKPISALSDPYTYVPSPSHRHIVFIDHDNQPQYLKSLTNATLPDDVCVIAFHGKKSSRPWLDIVDRRPPYIRMKTITTNINAADYAICFHAGRLHVIMRKDIPFYLISQDTLLVRELVAQISRQGRYCRSLHVSGDFAKFCTTLSTGVHTEEIKTDECPICKETITDSNHMQIHIIQYIGELLARSKRATIPISEIGAKLAEDYKLSSRGFKLLTIIEQATDILGITLDMDHRGWYIRQNGLCGFCKQVGHSRNKCPLNITKH